MNPFHDNYTQINLSKKNIDARFSTWALNTFSTLPELEDFSTKKLVYHNSYDILKNTYARKNNEDQIQNRQFAGLKSAAVKLFEKFDSRILQSDIRSEM